MYTDNYPRDEEQIATGAGVGVCLGFLVVVEVFNLDLIVEG